MQRCRDPDTPCHRVNRHTHSLYLFSQVHRCCAAQNDIAILVKACHGHLTPSAARHRQFYHNGEGISCFCDLALCRTCWDWAISPNSSRNARTTDFDSQEANIRRLARLRGQNRTRLDARGLLTRDQDAQGQPTHPTASCASTSATPFPTARDYEQDETACVDKP